MPRSLKPGSGYYQTGVHAVMFTVFLEEVFNLSDELAKAPKYTARFCFWDMLAGLVPEAGVCPQF
jgi:hypothetical protein